MTAALALQQAEAVGIRLQLGDGDAVEMQATASPPRDVVEALRQHRDEVVVLLRRRRASAALLQAVSAAAEAIAQPEADAGLEAAETAAALATKAAGEPRRPLPAADHQRHLTGLRGAALQRPPSWSDQSSRPTPGCWCSCCRGQRWWAPLKPSKDGTGIGAGWCCSTCHPPPDDTGIEEVATNLA